MNNFNVVIIGSGMGGSACATVLQRTGLSVALIERGAHPRFAIGESATPVMSKKIKFLGNEYDIPEFVALSTYDRIKEHRVGIECGPKELFHYFVHDKGQETPSKNGEIREFIVQTPEVDAQYLRAESDEYLVEVAKNYGVKYFDHTSVDNVEFNDDGVILSLSGKDDAFKIKTDFVVDATGFKSIIGEKFNLKATDEELNVPLNSRSIFAHFDGVNDFEKILAKDQHFVNRSPVSRKRATQHHCFEGGWMWVIPFENGKVSLGLNLDLDKYPMNELSGEDEFWQIVNQFPVLQELIGEYINTMPFIKTGRMQFANKQMVGDRWAMLPASAYGLDAWFSTGLASAFIAIHRLAVILNEEVFAKNRFKRDALLKYEVAMKKEYVHVAKMVNGMYKSFKHFDVFKDYCSLCFMGAESYLASGGIEAATDLDKLLLNAGNEDFCQKFDHLYSEVIRLANKEKVEPLEVAQINKFIVDDMAEYNFRRFGDSAMQGVHPRTSMFVNS
jgi:FADH2 O2-dependent halogenase